MESKAQSLEIRGLVEGRTNKLVDELEPTIKEIISKQTDERVKVALTETNESLASMNGTISEAKVSLGKILAIVNLTELITDAQNDDRSAFDELKKIANDQNNPLAKKADTAWRSLSTSFGTALQLEFNVPWLPDVDPSKLSLWALELAYNDAAEQTTRIGILQYMWKRSDIPKVQKLDLLLKIARHDLALKLSHMRLLHSKGRHPLRHPYSTSIMPKTGGKGIGKNL